MSLKAFLEQQGLHGPEYEKCILEVEKIINKKGDSVYFPDDSPFTQGQQNWLGGFLSGLNSRIIDAQGDSKNQESGFDNILVLYGTQTGNAESLAEEAAEKASEFGMKANVCGMDEITSESLLGYDRTLLITSTYGDGEMPDNAQVLWDEMNKDSAPRLEKTHFAVLGLGDTSYDLFCQAAVDWDKRLEALGGHRVMDRVDCDLDYEEPFSDWITKVMPVLAKIGGSGPKVEKREINTKPVAKSKWSKKSPFHAKLTLNKILTKNASTKETRHYEISLEGSDMNYEVGDALGVIPTNCPDLVSSVIDALSLDPFEEIICAEGSTKSLKEVLTNDMEIKLPSKELISSVAKLSGDSELNELLLPENKSKMSDFMWGRDLIDFLIDYENIKFTAEDFIALLKPIQPRLYSISSSISKHPGEVHLTVASVRYESHGRQRIGVCSTFLADRINEDTPVKCYLAPNKNFGVPSDDSLPMIMVGPGTGIAPFRAFLEEREMSKATGKNWLFFGERNRESDFFYEEEFSLWQDKGLLTRLDLAFSRDQENKIYVQDRMLQQGAELYEWLQQGGYFFVCGDAQRMAKDVDKALHTIVIEHGNLSEEDATHYINEMKKDKRYVRDVY